MEELKRFILLVQTSMDGRIVQALGSTKKGVVELNCHKCSWNAGCPIYDRLQCPMKDLVGISSNLLYIVDADDYQSIKKGAIDLLYLLPMVKLLFLIDFEKDIGYIYKAEGTIRKVKNGIVADSLKHYESYCKISVVLEIKDVRLSRRFHVN